MNFKNRLKDLLILCIPDKKGRYTMFPQCTCLFRLYGFGVPTTPIPAYSLLTPHRFVRLLFGKTSQNWCSPGVVPQISPEFRLKIHRICVLILRFTGRSASSWGCCKIGSVFVQQNPTASTKSGDFDGNSPTSSNTVHESCTRFWSRPHFRGF